MRPCPACSRHVREATCPFCGAAVPAATRSVFAGPATRAAVFTALAGCWTGNTPEPQHVDEHTTETQSQKKPPPPPPATTGTIEGTVTDSSSGAALSFAQVTLVEANRVAQTDAQGHYTFEGVAPGSYTIRVLARSGNPRSGGAYAQASVVVGDTGGARADVQVAVPVYHYNPHQAPMPYGAPPARRRIV